MKQEGRIEAKEAVGRMLGRLAREFGVKNAGIITRVMAEELGGVRLVFPDIQDMERQARNVEICGAFNGRNGDELAIRYGITSRQVRRILAGQTVVMG